jgi:hypothetical protein
MPAPDIMHRATVQRTVKLDPDANKHLATMIPTRTGHGAYISRLILEDKLRRELSAHYAEIAAKEEWTGTGLEVLD